MSRASPRSRSNETEFAALLKLRDNCSSQIVPFAKKYVGKKVRFDGAITNMQNHGSYETRFDFLVEPGNFDPNSGGVPTFRFRDKSVFDLNLTGKNIPEYVRAGQNYTFIAELGEFNADNCLYQLSPVETKVR